MNNKKTLQNWISENLNYLLYYFNDDEDEIFTKYIDNNKTLKIFSAVNKVTKIIPKDLTDNQNITDFLYTKIKLSRDDLVKSISILINSTNPDSICTGLVLSGLCGLNELAFEGEKALRFNFTESEVPLCAIFSMVMLNSKELHNYINILYTEDLLDNSLKSLLLFYINKNTDKFSAVNLAYFFNNDRRANEVIFKYYPEIIKKAFPEIYSKQIVINELINAKQYDTASLLFLKTNHDIKIESETENFLTYTGVNSCWEGLENKSEKLKNLAENTDTGSYTYAFFASLVSNNLIKNPCQFINNNPDYRAAGIWGSVFKPELYKKLTNNIDFKNKEEVLAFYATSLIKNCENNLITEITGHRLYNEADLWQSLLFSRLLKILHLYKPLPVKHLNILNKLNNNPIYLDSDELSNFYLSNYSYLTNRIRSFTNIHLNKSTFFNQAIKKNKDLKNITDYEFQNPDSEPETLKKILLKSYITDNNISFCSDLNFYNNSIMKLFTNLSGFKNFEEITSADPAKSGLRDLAAGFIQINEFIDKKYKTNLILLDFCIKNQTKINDPFINDIQRFYMDNNYKNYDIISKLHNNINIFNKIFAKSSGINTINMEKAFLLGKQLNKFYTAEEDTKIIIKWYYMFRSIFYLFSNLPAEKFRKLNFSLLSPESRFNFTIFILYNLLKSKDIFFIVKTLLSINNIMAKHNLLNHLMKDIRHYYPDTGLISFSGSDFFLEDQKNQGSILSLIQSKKDPKLLKKYKGRDIIIKKIDSLDIADHCYESENFLTPEDFI
ncbi:MAG: hypothetical protein ACQESP_12850, partial [Candidatus Muiribacteriota bacterium]